MNLILFQLFSLEFSSTPSPKFWLSSAMNSSGTDSERLTVTKALTTDLGILSPREEAMATETHRKSENMATIPRGGPVTPIRETMSFGKSTVALEDHDPCGHQSVTPAKMTITPMHLQTETPGEKIDLPPFMLQLPSLFVDLIEV